MLHIGWRSKSEKKSRKNRQSVGRFRPALEALEDRFLPVTVFWTNSAGGSWIVPANWSTGTIPAAADDVVIDVPEDVTITYPSGTRTVRSINSSETLTISGGSLSVATASTLNGPLTITGGTLSLAASSVLNNTLTLSGGTLTGGGDLTVNGLINWTSGGMGGGGRTVANGGIAISGNTAKTVNGRTIDNPLVATWSGTGGINANNLTWNNLPGSLFTAEGDAAFGNSSVFFNNDGVLQKAGGTGTTSLGFVLANRGAVEALTGTLSLNGRQNSRGAFTVAAGATLRFGGGPQTLQPGSSVTGEGDVVFGGGTTSVRGSYAVSGNTTVAGGTANFESSVVLPGLTLSGGLLGGAATVTVNGPLVWTGGGMGGGGRTVANGGISLSGPDGKRLITRILDNPGTATWTGTGNFEVRDGAIWNNLPGSLFDIQNDQNFGRFSIFNGRGTFNNFGTYRKSAGTGLTYSDLTLNNHGLVEVNSGTLDLAGGGVSTGGFIPGAGTTLEFGGGSHILTPGSYLFGDGDVRFDSETFNNMFFSMFGVYYITGATRFVATNLPFTAPSVEFNGETYFTTLDLTAGSLFGFADFVILGPWNWTGGTMGGLGPTYAYGGITISGDNGKGLSARQVYNFATATWTGAGPIGGGSSASFYNLEGALFDAQTDAAFNGVTFQNFGTFRKSAGSGFTSFDGFFDNFGVVELQTGTLSVGSYYQSEQATLVVTLGGLTPGTQFSRLQVGAGGATLGGTLTVTLAGDFSPASGNSFAVVTYPAGSASGEFATVNPPDLGGLSLVLVYSTISLTLVVA